jgi:hypothetical protein
MSDKGEFISLEEAERLEERARRGNGAGRAGRFRLEAFDAIEVGEGPEWLIEGIAPAPGLTVVYGEPGCGKSFLAADMGLAVAQGHAWGGRAVKPGGVVYISAEGASGFRKRIAAYRDHHGIADVVPFYLIADCPDLGSRPGDAGALADAIRDQIDAEVAAVIIDTLARTMLGADENNAAEMGLFIENCARISNELSCTVIVVHHTGKDASKGARGSTVLKAAADAEILVAGDEHRRTATLTKSKDAEGGFEFAFRLDPYRFEAHGREVSSCVLAPLGEWQKPDAGGRRRLAVTGPAGIALKALREAIEDAGERLPDTGHTPDKRGCPVSLWRGYAERMQISEADNAEAKRKAFKRAAERLQGLEIIGVWNEWVWINE